MSGIRLEDPDYAPSSIKTLCKNCWNANPDKRPDFEDILHFIKNNFKIKTRDTHFESREYNNMYSITYARLQFHETTIKNQFVSILQTINDSTSEPLTNGKNSMDISVSKNSLPTDDFSPSATENEVSSYKTVDPIRSHALMACQMELEIEKAIESPKRDEGKTYL